jgi:UDP-N-acetylmuramyl pentapeptide phosphotransferase/UDP-N-acetylglucosamine-1-phosphate transferase
VRLTRAHRNKGFINIMPDTKRSVPVVHETVQKPGYKSTEFYLSLAAVIIGAVASSGILEGSDGLTKVVGLIMAALVALGYTGSRLTLKKLDAANGNGTNSNS